MHIRFKPVVQTDEGTLALEKYQRALMKATINQNHNRIRCYQRQIQHHEEDMRRRASAEHLNQLKGFLNSRSREKRLNKIQNLREKKSILL